MTPATEGFVEVEGGRVWYAIAGDGPGVPLLLLHGGPGISSDYLKPLAALADERAVIRYDQLGAGRSDRPDDPALWNAARYERELATVRRALKLERVHMLGQSWGTMLAVDHVLAGGAGVASLTLSSPCLSVTRWRKDAEVLIAAMPAADMAAINNARATETYGTPAYQAAAYAYSKRHLCRLEPWPAAMLGMAGSMNRAVYTAVWGPTDFEATGDCRDYERAADLDELTMPVLYISGRYDGATPDATAWYRSLTPNAEMVVFEGSSHVPHLEEPDLFLRTVRGFLQRVDVQ